MIPIGKSKQTVVEHLMDMLADPLCLDEMTGYQEKAVEKVIALLDGIDIGRLEAICDAERDGRLVVLPVSIGSPIWRLHHPVGCPPFIESGKMRYCDLDWWGKNAFSTREEAEKALQEGLE